MKRLITLHSENLFFLFLFALLIIGFLCSSVAAENGPSPLVTPGSVSGLGTMAVVDSPVPVANGGTGATTPAAGLAALGGASLNGSSTVAFNASTINGVAPLTAAEKTQALVGSSTVAYAASRLIGGASGSISVALGSVATVTVVLPGDNGTYIISAYLAGPDCSSIYSYIVAVNPNPYIVSAGATLASANYAHGKITIRPINNQTPGTYTAGADGSTFEIIFDGSDVAGCTGEYHVSPLL